jgi:hypothetical protein
VLFELGRAWSGRCVCSVVGSGGDLERDWLCSVGEVGAERTVDQVGQPSPTPASHPPPDQSIGESHDNAVAESFFRSLKTELIYRRG